LGNQALDLVVMTKVLARLAVEHFEALALSGAVDDMHQPRRLDRFALLIQEYARVIVFARGLLDVVEQLQRACLRGLVGGAGGLVGSAQRNQEHRSQGPASGRQRPAHPHAAARRGPTERLQLCDQRPAPPSNETCRTALGPAIWRWASR